MKVLLIEPSPTVRRVVLRVLSAFPEAEIVVADGAADLAEIEPPSELAVLGWSSETDAGLDTLRALRARPGCESTRAVIVSERGAHEDVRRAMSEGAADYVLRPVTADALAERLARFVEPAANTVPPRAAA